MVCGFGVGAEAFPKFTGSGSSQKGPAPALQHWIQEKNFGFIIYTACHSILWLQVLLSVFLFIWKPGDYEPNPVPQVSLSLFF